MFNIGCVIHVQDLFFNGNSTMMSMAFNEKGLTIVSKHWIIDDITISKAFG
jgi:hypothetical protein